MKVANELSNRMIMMGIIKEEDAKLYQYGIANGIILLTNMITAFIIGIITGRMIEVLIFLLSLISLRSFTGGLHLDNKIMCYICSNLILMIPAYGKEIGFYFSVILQGTEKLIGIVSVLCATGIIFFLCPMDSKKRKLDLAEKSHFKVRARFILIVQLLVVGLLYFSNFNLYMIPICISLCIIAILMLFGKVQLILQKCEKGE